MPEPLHRDLQSLKIDRSKKTGDHGSRKWLWVGLMALVALCVAGVLAFMPERVGSGIGAKPHEVEVTMVVRQAASADGVVLTAGGYIIPRHRIDVASKMSGRVEEVLFEKGDFVRKGQVLARLDDTEYKVQLAQAQANRAAAQARLNEALAGSRPQEVQRAQATLDSAESNLRNAELNLNRAKQLARSGVLAKQLLDESQNTYDTAAAQVKVARENFELARIGPRKEQIELARAQVAEAEASTKWWETQIENTIIRAPVDGTVLDRLLEKGEMVTTGFFGGGRGPKPGVASLANLKELEVELDINEADIPKVKPNQPCSASPDSYPDRKYKAHVREIAPEANRQKATIQVKVAFDNVDEYLRPETNAKVNFLEDAKPADTTESRILVPKGSVVTAAGLPSVYLLRDGKAVRQAVKTGKELWGQLEIVAGLNGGERLIVKGLDGLNDGDRVALKQP